MVGRSYDWLWGYVGGVIFSCILKWWLNGVWSEEITWPIYIVIHSAHAVVFFIIRTWIRGWIKEEETPSVWERIFMSLHWTGLYLALFPLLVLYPVSYDGIGAVGTQALMQEGWWNPLVWVECWWMQMQAIGWIKTCIAIIALVSLALYITKANWREWKWIIIGAVIVLLLLWYLPFVMFLLSYICEGVVELLLSLAAVLDFLSPE